MYSTDIRWRAVTLVYVYGVELVHTARVLGVSVRSLRRWHGNFERYGRKTGERSQRRSRYSPEVLDYISSFVQSFPCFYVEELRVGLLRQFPGARLRLSHATILRALRFDLGLSRKVLEKRAREALPQEVAAYKSKMASFYSYPEQVVFVDETSKNGTDSARKYGWSRRGSRAVVRRSSSRGTRVSVLAACDTNGFLAWTSTRGTFTRNSFHEGFVKTVVPTLNPWPLPRSIVVIDNAKIHMYAELADVVEQCGALLIYLPPYCPHLNPIEFMFARLKQWLTRRANLVFPLYPEKVLETAMRVCLRETQHGRNIYRHCGYGEKGLEEAAFKA